MFVAYTGTSSYLLYDLETNCILSASSQQTDFDEAFSLRVDYGLSQNSEYPDIMQYKPSMQDISRSDHQSTTQTLPKDTEKKKYIPC